MCIRDRLIYAQNFSMPAGYVQDKDGESWLLKVGEEYNSVKDISGALLLHCLLYTSPEKAHGPLL